MNKIESKFNFKTFITFLTVLILTLSLAFATACGNTGSSDSDSNSSSSSDSSSETAVDEQTLKNGDFEFTSGKNTTKPNTATSWTVRSDGADEGFSTGTSSSYVLIDTEDSAFDALTSEYKHSYTETVDGQETTKYTNPRTPFYNAEAENKGLVDNDETEANEAGTKIMMLRNKDYSAQYATSSTTLTVPVGEYGVISVWVNTLGIEGRLGNTDVGAYIKLKHNVVDVNNDDKAYDPLLIKNIDTEGKWVKYVIYLEPNQLKATSYTLVLGLGEGNSVEKANHVKGFAFFDCAEFALINESDFPTEQPEGLALPNDSTINTKDCATVNGDFDVAFTLRTSSSNDLDVSTDSVGTWNAVNPNTQDYKVKEDATKISVETGKVEIDFTGFGDIGSSYTHATKAQTLEPQHYVRISFLVKVTTKEYQTGATLAIYDVEKGEVVASFDNVTTNDYENENTDGFARYTFYIANNFANSQDVMSYQLKLSYGPTEKGEKALPLPTGTAIFKDFIIEELSKEEYGAADTTSNANAKKVALTGTYQNDYVEEDDEEEDDDGVIEDYTITVNGMNEVLVKNGELVPVHEILKDTLTTDAPDGVVGLANSQYVTNASAKAALDYLVSKNDNNPVQAIVLVSDGTTEYSISGKNVTIPENSTYAFSVKVYAHSGNAFVRLVDANKVTESDKHVVFTGTDTVTIGAMKTVITTADCTRFEDGYAIVTYVITTGSESLKVKFEFGSNGVAVFDEFNCGASSLEYTSAEALIDKYVPADGVGAVYTFKKTEVVPQIYYYASEDDVGQEDLRLKDDDGEVRVKNGNKTTTIALGGANADATEYFVQYYRFDTDDLYEIDAGEETDSETESDSESDTEEDEESTTEVENYGWLQVTSIIIALVLVAALIAVVVRKSLEGKSSKKRKTQNYYQGYDKSNRRSGKNDVAVPDAEDTAKDYDYDNPENN